MGERQKRFKVENLWIPESEWLCRRYQYEVVGICVSVCMWMFEGTGLCTHTVQRKSGYCCEYTQNSVFLCCYSLIIVLFSIWTTVNLVFPHPVYVCVCVCARESEREREREREREGRGGGGGRGGRPDSVADSAAVAIPSAETAILKNPFSIKETSVQLWSRKWVRWAWNICAHQTARKLSRISRVTWKGFRPNMGQFEFQEA